MTDEEYQVVVSAEEQQRAEELGEELPATLPVLPLKETVVFPESMTPLAIGQERSIRLIDDVVGGDRLLALVTVQDEDADPPGWDDLYEIGTAAVVHKMIRVPDGTLRVLVQGIRRVRLVRQAADEPYLVGEFVELPDEIEETKEARGTDAQRAGALRADHRPRPVSAGGAPARRGERRRSERALPSRRVDAAPEDRREAAAPRRGVASSSGCARCR